MSHIKRQVNSQGFTLIEILLVLVIVSAVIWGSVSFLQQRALQTRIDRTSIQMQQILNAGLAYYVMNGNWPLVPIAPAGALDCLKGTYTPPLPVPPSTCSTSYLPTTLINNSWGNPYLLATTPTLFYVYSEITSSTASPTASGSALVIANTISGILPLSYVTTKSATIPLPSPGTITPCTDTDTSCMVVASVNIPGQNLNNARGVNFAGLYHHGGCVPVPTCPGDPSGTVTMRPQVMFVPVSVSGVNNTDNPSQVYPISSFTAFASGDPAMNPPACPGPGIAEPCKAVNSPSASATYWRACLQITTTQGDVATTNTGNGSTNKGLPNEKWGGKVTLMAITRCAPSNEPSGSPDTVFSR